MAYDVISQSPSIDAYTPLEEHHEQTPGTFFGGKPVLHLHCSNATLSLSAADVASQPDFAAFVASHVTESQDVIEIPGVEVWVTSRFFVLFSTGQSHGLQIHYPTISIHAQEGRAILLELNLSGPDTMDEDLVFMQLRVFPESVDRHGTARAVNGDRPDGETNSGRPVVALFNAISACQELNPDPATPEEGGGRLAASAPGATGWVTSENMTDFMDEDGSFRMPGGVTMVGGEADIDQTNGDDENASPLGEGAGHRRNVDDVEPESSAPDDAKWQRTG